MPPITPLTKRLIVLNAIVFVLMMVLSFSPAILGGVIRWFGITPDMWFPLPPVWQLVTYGFMHDTGGLSHLLFNMLGLFFFGSMVEREVGSMRMGIAYFGAMLAGGFAHLIAGWIGNGAISALGASGAVLGILVAAAVLQPNAKVIFIIFPMTLKVLVTIVVAMDAFALLTAFRDGGGDGVAHWVHLGGAAFGFLWARMGFIHVDWLERHRQKQRQATQQQELNANLHMDELLVKIQKQGISSLSDKERAFLKKMSERRQ